MCSQSLRELREEMVDTQLRKRGIHDERLLACMAAVPRHCFVPRNLIGQAYEDRPLPIGEGQTISQPYMVACMTALLELSDSDRVLEIGTGSGYQTAILAQLCREVISIERHASLWERARAILGQLQIENVRLYCGDGTLGCEASAPFDRIIVTAGGPHIPAALSRQLGEGGRLVCPVGERKRQQLMCIEKRGADLATSIHTDCVFVPLVGEDGWHEP